MANRSEKTVYRQAAQRRKAQDVAVSSGETLAGRARRVRAEKLRNEPLRQKDLNQQANGLAKSQANGAYSQFKSVAVARAIASAHSAQAAASVLVNGPGALTGQQLADANAAQASATATIMTANRLGAIKPAVIANGSLGKSGPAVSMAVIARALNNDLNGKDHRLMDEAAKVQVDWNEMTEAEKIRAVAKELDTQAQEKAGVEVLGANERTLNTEAKPDLYAAAGKTAVLGLELGLELALVKAIAPPV